jgi:DNA-binding transcriptional LysR family regulator
MPVLYGARAIVPALAPFLARHSELKVEIIMSDTRQNLITDGVDVAIRLGVGQLEDSSFGARRLALIERVVIAAPTYLLANGVPTNPTQLSNHDCILQHGLFGRESWRFTHNQTVASVDVTARLWINSASGVLAAAAIAFYRYPYTDITSGKEFLHQSG